MLAFAPYVVLALHIVVCAVKEWARDATDAVRYHELIDAHDQERYAWTRERNELVSRIQAPHLIPHPLPISQGKPPADEPPISDEWDLVGQIITDAPPEPVES